MIDVIARGVEGVWYWAVEVICPCRRGQIDLPCTMTGRGDGWSGGGRGNYCMRDTVVAVTPPLVGDAMILLTISCYIKYYF